MRQLRKKIFDQISGFSIFEKLLVFLPFLIWFSYYPNFHIGKNSGMNLEFSLILVFCVFLAIFSLIEIVRNWAKFSRDFISERAIGLTFVFVFWNFLSIIWSFNPLRTFLTAGIWLVLWLIFVGIYRSRNMKKIAQILKDNLIISAIIIAFLTFAQVAVGAFSDFGLCRGCLAHGFGFARPSAFAIEPQFLGSLFLAPILFVWRDFLVDRTKKSGFFLFILLAALYLTLSRGAIFALIPAMFLTIFILKNEIKSVKFGVFAFLFAIVLSFGAGVFWHAIFTELNPRVSDGFYDSISKSVNQMTLGKISLPKKTVEKPVENSQKISQDKTENSSKNEAKKAIFDGYVEKSTDERTRMSDLAIEVWSKNPRNAIFGVGAGGAGRAIFETTQKTGNSAEIVQNEFLSILLELGVVGLIIFALIIGGFIKKTSKNRFFWAVLFAFLIHWNFFSGLPNAMHIYLILAVVFVFCHHESGQKVDKNSIF